jgi:hypothetical protein
MPPSRAASITGENPILKITTAVIAAALLGLGSMVISGNTKIAVLKAEVILMKQQDSEIVKEIKVNNSSIQDLGLKMERLLAINPADVYKKLESVEAALEVMRTKDP